MTPTAGGVRRPLWSSTLTQIHARVVEGDASRLAQAISNLLSNAIKFTPPGGRVTVSLERRDREVVLRVCDTGEGIAPHALPHLFERFWQAWTTRTSAPAAGLAWGSRSCATSSRCTAGWWKPESAGRGKGATFTVTLPIHAGSPSLSDPSSGVRSGGRRERHSRGGIGSAAPERGLMTISTRRLAARPSGVAFVATGSRSPSPSVDTREGSTP